MNIQNSIRLLADAAKVNATPHLLKAEKITLLTALADSVFIDMPGCPPHATIVRTAIERMIEDERKPDTASTEKQGRKTQGVAKPTEVVAGRATEGTEAEAGKAAGIEGQTEDAGRADSSKPAPATAQEAKAPERPAKAEGRATKG
jgi:hypothetical protein